MFHENGFYATGVDSIMRQANVSKRTMYAYFRTKNELIVEVLHYFHTNCRSTLNQLLCRDDLSGREKILAVFDGSVSWFSDPDFHGCLAINAMGEFSGKDPAIEKACRLFKEWEIDVFRALAKDADALNPDDLGYKLVVLLDGLGTLANVIKQPCPIDIRKMVVELLDSHNA